MRVLLFFCLFVVFFSSARESSYPAERGFFSSVCQSVCGAGCPLRRHLGCDGNPPPARAHTHTLAHARARLSGWHFYITASLSQQEGSPVIYLMLTVYELTLLTLISAWNVLNSTGLFLLLD